MLEISLDALVSKSYDDHGGQNNFYPLRVCSAHNLMYQSSAARMEDIGESAPNGHSILAFNHYFRWPFELGANYTDVDNVVWRIECAGRDLDLKGGTAYPFVVVFDVVNGHQVPSSGRYWLRSKPLDIGTFKDPAINQFTVPSNTGWVCTFSRAGAVVNAPASPDLRYIECVGVGFQDYQSIPTGDFGIKSFRIG